MDDDGPTLGGATQGALKLETGLGAAPRLSGEGTAGRQAKTKAWV